ncbi:IS630 transposase-related protein, partial [Candidatus Halobeggiatoa sp. HSG11]|nr:IS630 transposase-related protein [Candidatus Halobeggiatoa sp. HSG11]
MSYSIDFRKRAIDFVIEEKNSMRSASKIFDIQYNTMKEWVKRFKETGEFSPKPILGKQPTKINLATLKKQVSEHPDWFQHEHAQTFDVTQ